MRHTYAVDLGNLFVLEHAYICLMDDLQLLTQSDRLLLLCSLPLVDGNILSKLKLLVFNVPPPN